MKGPIAVVSVALLVLAGCTPGTAPTTPAPTTASTAATSAAPSAAPVVLGEAYDLPADRDVAQWGEPLASKVGRKLSDRSLNMSRQGWRVDLMGVYRLADDRVLAEFRLNADNAVRPDMQVWQDPAYDAWFHEGDRRNGGYYGKVWEFADVRLTVTGDDASYRAVRTATGYCLCSMAVTYPKGRGDVPAYVVVSAPKGATSVDLSLRDVGTFAGVAVSPTMPTRSVVPLGSGYQLRLLTASRPASGGITVRFAIEAPEAGIEGTTFVTRRPDQLGSAPWQSLNDYAPSFQALVAVDPGGVWGGWPKPGTKGACDSCTELDLAGRGKAVEGEITVPDPGSPDVLVAPTVGWPFSAVAAAGSATRSDAAVRYRWRQVTTGATIGDGEIDLDTAVLFNIDKATLTGKANAVLDRAAKALQGQEGRSVSIVGHTDSTGSTAHNQNLSERRAAAVRAALQQRLGTGWTFSVAGRAAVARRGKESGLSGDKLTRARALNRRVEVSVK